MEVKTTTIKTQHKAASKKQASGRQTQKHHKTKGLGGAPVSTKTNLKSVRDNSAHALKGTDRLVHIKDLSQFKHGDVMLQSMVTPADFARLKGIAKSFQRIKWVELSFEVHMQNSSATPGGYVAGFVPDPEDSFEGSEDDLNRLTSSPGSKTQKMWESCFVKARPPKTLLFTSSSVEPRLFSPGQFILLTDGETSATDSSCTVFVHWKVSLSVPSVENEENLVPGFTNETIIATNNKEGSLWLVHTSPGGTPSEVFTEAEAPGISDFYANAAADGRLITVGDFDCAVARSPRNTAAVFKDLPVTISHLFVAKNPSKGTAFVIKGGTQNVSTGDFQVFTDYYDHTQVICLPGELVVPDFVYKVTESLLRHPMAKLSHYRLKVPYFSKVYSQLKLPPLLQH